MYILIKNTPCPTKYKRYNKLLKYKQKTIPIKIYPLLSKGGYMDDRDTAEACQMQGGSQPSKSHLKNSLACPAEPSWESHPFWEGRLKPLLHVNQYVF